MKQATLVFLLKDNKVLLGMKKRGFGVGKWNGIGGKVAENETVEEAVRREAKEEIGVELKQITKMAECEFRFEDKPDWGQNVTTFVCEDWNGEPVESEEMKPEWFDFEMVPYEQMWEDDKLWLPSVFGRKFVKGKFWFDKNVKMVNYELE